MKVDSGKNPLRILMLGWEFPPVINGGLGVACHDLCIALARQVHVTMIIPKSNPAFKVQNLQLIGLNNLDARTLQSIDPGSDYADVGDVHYIDSDLNPYYAHPNTGRADSSADLSGKYFREVEANGKRVPVFTIDDLYGGDVIDKVHVFGRLAARLAMTLDFDVIHAHDWMTMSAAREIKERTGKPLVMHVHSLEIDRGGASSRNWVYQHEKSSMEQADVIMPVSEFTAGIIREHYHIDSAKIFPVHNGIRPVKPFRSQKPFSEKLVLFVGRLTRQKGPEFFLQIAARVLEKVPDVRFVMAGQGDSYAALVEKSAHYGLGNRFHLTGFLTIEKVHELLSQADVYCMPSVSEPFGLSAVEAVQFGIPVVISRQSGVAEVLRGSLTFDFWDIHKAADYIIALLRDDTLRDKVVSDATHDLDHISWDLSAEKVLEGYRRFGIGTPKLQPA